MSNMSKKCLICQRKNDTIYHHLDEKTNKIWIWCQGVCQRGYSLERYCELAGVDPIDYINNTNIKVFESKPNEVNAMSWPSHFVPLSDPRAAKGIEYIKSRGLNLNGDMYYDIEEEGIVFPYYIGQQFCGAQIRFIETRIKDDEEWKITTLPGTRLGLLVYNWNQEKFMNTVRGVIITEGAFNALSINQSLNLAYGSVINNPWRVVACSGSGVSDHQREIFKELKDSEMKVIVAPDMDEAGKKMFNKLLEADAITNYAFTREIGVDWNDKLVQLGHKEFAKFFLTCVEKI